MTITVTCRPISTYPVPETRVRKAAPFHRKNATGHGGRPILLSDALDLLEREVRCLGARRLIIEADFREGQIRQDGWPKADARPASPRVVVSLPESRHGPLRYPCDTFTRFEDNVMAIARALEALRMVDRYGVTRRGEQYAGWKQLPPATAPTMTTEAAAALVDRLSDSPTDPAELLQDHQIARACLREALRRAHPDTGGTADLFHQVQTARAVLTAHHGVTL